MQLLVNLEEKEEMWFVLMMFDILDLHPLNTLSEHYHILNVEFVFIIINEWNIIVC